MVKRIRKYHRWFSFFSALPVFLIVVTGILLILRGKLDWIQEKSPKLVTVNIEKIRPISEVLQKLDREKIEISSIIYKPAKKIYTIRTRNYREIHLHPETLETLSEGPKLSTLLIKLHEGTFFSSWVRDFIFLPTSLILLFLWGSGLFLFLAPYYKKYRRQKKLSRF